MWRHFTSTTPIYSVPTLYYASLNGEGPYSIRLRITTYRVGAENAKLNIIRPMPGFVGNSALYGSSYLSEGAGELPRIQLSGHIDTPKEQVGTKVRSTVLLSGYRVTLGELIATAFEGRASSNGAAIDPDYFVDPFGRKFDKPRIIEFTSAYIQGVPFRENFNLTLQLTRGSAS